MLDNYCVFLVTVLETGMNIINILIPPLRDRKEDVVDLATHFVRRYRQAFKKDIDFLPDKIINRLF